MYYLSQEEGGGHRKSSASWLAELGINACGQLEPKLGRQQVNAASGMRVHSLDQSFKVASDMIATNSHWRHIMGIGYPCLGMCFSIL